MTGNRFEVLQDILRARYSCRGFLPDPVPRDTLEEILQAAQRAPSWNNVQPWQVEVTLGAETDRLRAALHARALQGDGSSDVPFPDRYEGVYQERRRACGWGLYAQVGVAKGDREASRRETLKNYRLFGAPVFVLVTTPRHLGAYGILDCGGFVTALMLAAEARGLGSIAMAAVANFSPFMRDWFEVPEDRDVLCGMALGLADPDAAANGFRTDRAGIEDVARFRG